MPPSNKLIAVANRHSRGSTCDNKIRLASTFAKITCEVRIWIGVTHCSILTGIIGLHTFLETCSNSFAAHTGDHTGSAQLLRHTNLLAFNIQNPLVCSKRKCLRPQIALIKLENDEFDKRSVCLRLLTKTVIRKCTWLKRWLGRRHWHSRPRRGKRGLLHTSSVCE